MPALKSESIKVTGLKELVKELKKLDDAGLTDALKDVNFEVAELVASAGKGRASTRMESRAAQSLKPSRQAARAQVTLGNAATLFAAGAEFGSIRWHQFRPWRGASSGAGYFLYPAIRAEGDNIVEKFGDAIEKITAKAFPD